MRSVRLERLTDAERSTVADIGEGSAAVVGAAVVSVAVVGNVIGVVSIVSAGVVDAVVSAVAARRRSTAGPSDVPAPSTRPRAPCPIPMTAGTDDQHDHNNQMITPGDFSACFGVHLQPLPIRPPCCHTQPSSVCRAAWWQETPAQNATSSNATACWTPNRDPTLAFDRRSRRILTRLPPRLARSLVTKQRFDAAVEVSGDVDGVSRLR